MSHEKIKQILESVHLMKSALAVRSFFRRIHCRIRYGRHLRRIRASVKAGNPIRVLFLSGNSAKWKCQPLFEAMKQSKFFEPLIALTLDPGMMNSTPLECSHKIQEDRAFFESLGDKTVIACDPAKGERLSLDSFRPDLVFLQEPGGNLPRQTVCEISSYALCCYVPYGVDILMADQIQYLPWFHNLLFLEIALNEAHKQYGDLKAPCWKRSGMLVPLGFPLFDCLQISKETEKTYSEPIVYAPHFSFQAPGVRRLLALSTFLQTGPFVLEYAKQHTEQRWVFKPHPRLRRELVEHGGWSKEEVDAYYSEWERIGSACYSSDYVELFRSSRAMVTDCASFLLEYSVTGNPLIRLVPPELNVWPRPEIKPLFDLFYEARSIHETELWFQSVLERMEDPRKNARLQILGTLGIYGYSSAKAILDYLEHLFAVPKVK